MPKKRDQRNPRIDSSTLHYLASDSPEDEYWDSLKGKSIRFAEAYLESGFETQQRRGERCNVCSDTLLFGVHSDRETGVLKHKLKLADFCRVRLCPICMQRKSLRWKARFHRAWPEIEKQYPTSRYLHLVLTVRNCSIKDLRQTLKLMNAAWNRLNSRKKFPGTGYLKSIEVTREMNYCASCKGDPLRKGKCKDKAMHSYSENVHPHIHVLLQVPASYFSTGYITKDRWGEMWKENLKVDYDPVVWVETVKSKSKAGKLEDAVACAVKEVAKYCVKIEDVIDGLNQDDGLDWFLELDRQLEGTRAVSLGGSFKKLMSEDEPTVDEMIRSSDEAEEVAAAIEFREYVFHRPLSRYALSRILSPDQVNPQNVNQEQSDSS